MTSVKYFHSAMTNAPVLNGVAGALIGVLDACLVSGFGLVTVDTLTVNNGIATATTSMGHALEPDAVVLVTGASVPVLNGEHRVIERTSNSFTYATTAPNGTATGTMGARLAPAGWEKAFTGTNLAAYRSADITGTRMFLQVTDTDARNARVVGFEGMTDVNTGTAPFPTAGQVAGGLWWPKANAAAGAARAWTLVADGRLFWLHVHTAATAQGADGFVMGFGDFASWRPADAFGCVLFGAAADVSAATGVQAANVFFAQQTSALATGYAPRSHLALGGSAGMFKRAESFARQELTSGGAGFEFPYPNGPDNGLMLSRMAVCEVAGNHWRGILPGVFFVPQAMSTASFGWRDKIDGQGALLGRKLLAVKCGTPAGTAATPATGFFDITGPWR